MREIIENTIRSDQELIRYRCRLVLLVVVVVPWTGGASMHSLPGRRSLRSTGTNRLLVPPVKRSTVDSSAFPVAGLKTWNALPEDVAPSQSEYTFHRQLKTWLFKKSFPDIVI